ncbi:BTAD domain-containing putative transcriptional regulator [Streptomyces sp. NPDC050485]|uniref:AfsR/SARP family transcriptional regulator n=1 Tax=Streptomyces sp. NPDC050485 TaxID=3365617 RepID=UPI003795D7AB
MIFCRVLGPIQVEIDGAAAQLGGPIPRRLLAALAAGTGSPVSLSTLAELVWDAELTAEVTNAIRVTVHRLRSALGPGERRFLESTPQGYRLSLAPEATDHGLFEQQVERCVGALTDADPSDAVRALESALALWRGRPWAELGESLHVCGLRARMAELREVAVEELQAARLALGDTARAVAALSQSVIEAPYRERRWELLALGLYRSGRQGHALAELRRVRGLLVEELGAEPGPALRALEQRMLAHDPGLLMVPGPARPDEPPSADPESRPPVIPRPLTRLIGRARELALLDAALAESRLVAITGPAGVGKTRLAVEYVADRADARLVRLANLRSPEVVAPTIAVAVGGTPTAADPLAAATRVLAGRHEVLVLDNCEHLTDALADVVLPLLARCPGLRILATSRRALGLDGEHVLTLAPLPIDGEDGTAVELQLARYVLADDQEAEAGAGARRALDLLVRAVAVFEQQPNGSDELGALYAGVFALALLGAPQSAAKLYAAVVDHGERNGTDPGRYMRFGGPSLEDRVTRLVASLPPVESGGPMAWEEIVARFTGAAEALSARP